MCKCRLPLTQMRSIEREWHTNKTRTYNASIEYSKWWNGDFTLSNDNDSSRCPQNLQLNSKYLLSNAYEFVRWFSNRSLMFVYYYVCTMYYTRIVCTNTFVVYRCACDSWRTFSFTGILVHYQYIGVFECAC